MQSFLHWNDPSVQAAIIGAIGSILTSMIAAICASVIGKQIAGRRRLREKLIIAQDDIEFLLRVEEFHCNSNREREGTSNKLTIRNAVRAQGLVWSGKFTPSRVSYNDGPGRRYSRV